MKYRPIPKVCSEFENVFPFGEIIMTLKTCNFFCLDLPARPPTFRQFQCYHVYRSCILSCRLCICSDNNPLSHNKLIEQLKCCYSTSITPKVFNDILETKLCGMRCSIYDDDVVCGILCPVIWWWCCFNGPWDFDLQSSWWQETTEFQATWC